MKYYLIWANYDGTNTEEFDTKEELEKWYTSFMEEDKGYVIGVYYGKEVELVATEIKTTYKVKE